MVTMEQVEKLREYAEVSYEEAKQALEKTNGNLLEALIELERQGKTKAPEGGGKYVSFREPLEEERQNGGKERKQAGGKQRETSSFADVFRRIFAWLGKMIQKGNVNVMLVERHDEQIIKLPLTVLVLLLLFGFWVLVPLLIVGLFFNFRYSFEGPDLGTEKVNKVMDHVAKAAEDIKSDISKGTDDNSSKDD